ncbi:MAG: helix-turn-helix domain-containing protein, partial [Desulfotomaculales bacterium]
MLVIGVSDKGEILGLKDWDKNMQHLANVAGQNCEPPVYFINTGHQGGVVVPLPGRPCALLRRTARPGHIPEGSGS